MLDTNVVLDVVVFDDPGAHGLKAAIESGRVRPQASAETLAELRRVLAYPEFELDEARQSLAYDCYASRCEVLDTPSPSPLLPRCHDADDQKFLDLAWAAQASHLVTKDRALLKLTKRIARLGRFLVTSPTDLRLPEA